MQNTPSPQQGRHRVAPEYGQPVQQQAGPAAGQYAGRRPEPGIAQRPQQIPAPYGPAFPAQPGPARSYPGPHYAPRSQPGQPYAAQPHPVQSHPTQSHATQSHPTQSHPTPAFPAQRVPAQPGQAQPAAVRPPQAHTPQAQPPAAQPPQAPAVAHAPQAPATAHAPQAQAMVQAPRNGLGIAALCLGLVGMLFGLIPFTGFIAFALGAIGMILGLVGFARSRKRIATNKKTSLAGVVLSTVAVALGIWGMVIVFTGLSQLSEDLSQIPTPSTSVSQNGTTLPADVTTPATTGPTTYQLEVTGTAEKMMVAYGTGSATSSASDYQSLPWRKTVETTDDYSFANVTATSSGPGSITCTITDTATGAVVSTKTSESLDNNEYSSATVSCSSMG